MHAAALVIVPKGHDVEETVHRLMAPYKEDFDSYPDDEDDRQGYYLWRITNWWDWYRIGGRWDGYYLGLDRLPESEHYTESWCQLERNSAPARDAGEWDTYTVVSPDGCAHKDMPNPDWQRENGYEDYEIPDPVFAQWRAMQLMKYQDGVVVVVDYHS